MQFKNIVTKVLFGLTAFALITSMILYLMGENLSGGLMLTFFWALLAICLGTSGKKSIKSFSYTAMILAVVVMSMTFPKYFISVGEFKVTVLIVPLLQLITFGVGSTLTFNDIFQVIKMPYGVFVGALCQFTIMPLVGFTIANIFSFPPEIAAGIVLVGASPSGLASNVMAYIAKANLALSVTITTVATLISPIMTPFLMKILGGQFVPVNFFAMLWDVTQLVIIPIVLGIVFNTLFHKKAKLLNKIMPKVSMAGIALIIVVTTAVGRDDLLHVGLLLLLAMFLHMTLGCALGYYGAKLFGLSKTDCRTVAIEVGMQNGGLASGLAAKMGKIATVGLAAAVNGPLMNTVFSMIATWWGRKSVSEKTFRTDQIKAMALDSTLVERKIS